MGCLGVLVAVLGLVIGLVTLPTIVDIVGGTDIMEGWAPLDAVVGLLPFAFLVLIIIGAIWAFGRGK